MRDQKGGNCKRRDSGKKGTGSAFLKSETPGLPIINISTSAVQEGKMRTGKSTRVVIGLIVALAFVFSAIGVPDVTAAKTKIAVTVTQTSGGLITPKGKNSTVQVVLNKKATFLIKPLKDYHVQE